jgi:hypothetical protein
MLTVEHAQRIRHMSRDFACDGTWLIFVGVMIMVALELVCAKFGRMLELRRILDV